MMKRARKFVNYSEQLDPSSDWESSESEEYTPKPKRPKLSPASTKKKEKAKETAKEKAAEKKVIKKRKSVFPFLELPGELRNSIYEYALTAKFERIQIYRCLDKVSGGLSRPLRRGVRRGSKKGKKDIALSLLRVCKQVHNEASLYLYTMNEFHFDSIGCLSSFAGRFPMRMPHLRTVVLVELYIQGDTRTFEQGFNMLAFAENLESLQINLTFARSSMGRHDVDLAAAKFYQFARNWLEAVGMRKNDKRAAMDILDVSFDTGYTYRTNYPPHPSDKFMDAVEKILVG